MTIVDLQERVTARSRDRLSDSASSLGSLAIDERRIGVDEASAKTAHILEWTGVVVVEPSSVPRVVDAEFIRANTILGSPMLPE